METHGLKNVSVLMKTMRKEILLGLSPKNRTVYLLKSTENS